MAISKKRKADLLSKARDLLTKGFRRGKWVVFPDGSFWRPMYADDDDLTSLRQHLARYPNPPECAVCAEGAIYLACASDPEATPADLRELLEHGRHRAKKIFGVTGYTSIPQVNDTSENSKETVAKLLELGETA